jgi:hypothetical protein
VNEKEKFVLVKTEIPVNLEINFTVRKERVFVFSTNEEAREFITRLVRHII